MPFGSEWVRDAAAVDKALRNLGESPMPFGSEWVRDSPGSPATATSQTRSPMPFGSEWVRDTGTGKAAFVDLPVSNAFRQ